MRIGIDAHGVGGHSLGLGNETYFRNLIASLLAIDHRNEYHIFINHPEALEGIVRDHSNVRLVSFFPSSQWIQRPLSIPFYARRHKLDLVHVAFIRPPFTHCKTVITVHDVSYEIRPEDYHWLDRWRMKLLVQDSCRRADLIFTVSNHARREINERYGIPMEKIVVTYNAADHAKQSSSSTAKVPVPLADLPIPYILFLGLIQPRKNLVRLIEAFDLFKSRTDLPHHLVIAGKWGWGNTELKHTLDQLKHRDHIYLAGYISSRDIDKVMRDAALFVFPSLYESFAIPPMEAQQLSVPALVANNTCFPEIYGDSVLYCDPFSVDSIAEGIAKGLQDSVIRMELIKRGHQRAREFSWAKTARIALAAYESLFPHSVKAEREGELANR
jgi:glycosyltransferase involved in cell wall biosynthesis